MMNKMMKKVAIVIAAVTMAMAGSTVAAYANYEVGQHVEVRTSMWGLFKHTAGGTITKVATDDKTGGKLCYVEFDHWYDLFDDWISEEYFE